MIITSIEAKPQPSHRIQSLRAGLSAATSSVVWCLMTALVISCLLIVIVDLSIPSALSPTKPLAPDFDTFAHMLWGEWST